MKTFFEIVPEDFIKSYNKSEHHVVFKNGSEVYFKYLKDGASLGSLNLGWWFIDEAEEVTEEIFIYLQGRLSLVNAACRGWLVSNPPNTDHWLYKRFETEKTEDYKSFHASTYENAKYLPEGYIQSLEKLPESWRKKYLEGQYGFTPDGTPFYQGFKEKLHVKDLSHYKPEKIYRVWDYGFHHPAITLHGIDSKGRWLVLKELLGTDITILDFGNFVKLRCKEWYPECRQWIDYGDPAGMQKTDKSEKTSVEILASLGVYVTSKQSTYRERKEIIERRLATLIEGIPSLLVDISCKVVIDGLLGGYHYPVRKQGQAYNANMEIPYKDGFYEHCVQTCEYFAVNMFEGAESKEDEGELTSRVVGEMKDVRWEVSEPERYSPQYRKIIQRHEDSEDYEDEPTVRYVAG